VSPVEHEGVPIRCSLCGRVDYVSLDRYPDEYEKLKEGVQVHHICQACANRLQAEAWKEDGLGG